MMQVLKNMIKNGITVHHVTFDNPSNIKFGTLINIIAARIHKSTNAWYFDFLIHLNLDEYLNYNTLSNEFTALT